ncbi:hypothetical protein MBAV_005211 [Candidatus Magnetobacterium bavaricum]|uniref:Uncharacterized protein n=1 Tax=Candidatus Magnetobacterium bavaricum TaxID=29290 RepID=A0A0F3GPI0_9BACT|nr:hypothetical protein MBAV_005211 [Candidatus Magnetobacterium bavaricum]
MAEAMTFKLQKQTLDIAIFCWNASFLPKNEQVNLIRRMRKDNDSDDYGAIQMIADMIERKLNKFSDVDRQIVAYEITEMENGGLFLNVASTLKD